MAFNIKKFKKHLEKDNIRGLALDIDETLSWTISYWVEKLSERFGNPENLSVQEITLRYRFAQNHPHWQTKEALDWMEKARTSNKVQEVLPLIENSKKTVQKINKIIPITAYITIRSEKVIPGTEKWLEKHGFPKAPVIAKPHELPYEMASEWKAQTLTKLYPQVLGIIDDNPSIIDYLNDDYKGYVFLYDNLMHQNKNINIIPCKTWENVLDQAKANFK